MVKKAGLGARLKVTTDSDYAANTYPSVFQSQCYLYNGNNQCIESTSEKGLGEDLCYA